MIPRSLACATLLVASVSGEAASQESKAQDSILLVARVKGAEQRFFMEWRKLWTVQYRIGQFTGPRLGAVHCHHDQSYEYPAIHIIRSWYSDRSMCPIWFPGPPPPFDERDGIDMSLDERTRPRARSSRATLLALIDSAAAILPGDPFIAGQRVRMWLDQGNVTRASEAARACRGDATLCAQLRGLVASAAGDIRVADSIFTALYRSVPEKDRCERTDISILLNEADRPAFQALPCEARGRAVERFWWLADPLWSDAFNERYVEHAARWTIVELHRVLSFTERWDWSDEHGGDAIAEALLRYGWPAVVGWGGVQEDSSHFKWLGFRDSSVNTSLEYAGRRTHTVPTLNQARMEALSTYEDPPLAPAPGRRGLRIDTRWWPIEHFAPKNGPLVAMEHQAARFRRESDALLTMGVAPVPEEETFIGPLSREAVLMVGRGPGDVAEIGRQIWDAGARTPAVVTGRVAPGAAVASLEVVPSVSWQGKPVMHDIAPGAGRARVGLTAPDGLTGFGRDSISLSDVLLFAPASSSEAPPVTLEAASSRMLGTTTLRGVRRLGLFWESYGVNSGDTVAVGLRLVRTDQPGFMSRLRSRFGLGRSGNAAMTLEWREPQQRPAGAAMTIAGVAVQSRSVVLDIGSLAPGEYTLEVSITRGSRSSTSERRIVIE